MMTPLGAPLGANDFARWVRDSFRKIEEEMRQPNAQDIIAQFEVTNLTADVRSLDVATATITDIAGFLGTLVRDLQRKANV